MPLPLRWLVLLCPLWVLNRSSFLLVFLLTDSLALARMCWQSVLLPNSELMLCRGTCQPEAMSDSRPLLWVLSSCQLVAMLLRRPKAESAPKSAALPLLSMLFTLYYIVLSVSSSALHACLGLHGYPKLSLCVVSEHVWLYAAGIFQCV